MSQSSNAIPLNLPDFGDPAVNEYMMQLLDAIYDLWRVSGRLKLVPTNPPASASAPGEEGTVTWDSSYIYVCIATDTWVRGSVSTW